MEACASDACLLRSEKGKICILSVVGAYTPLITRYNLVKVELDQVGEGLFRDIDSPVLLLSNEQVILRLARALGGVIAGL